MTSARRLPDDVVTLFPGSANVSNKSSRLVTAHMTAALPYVVFVGTCVIALAKMSHSLAFIVGLACEAASPGWQKMEMAL